MNLKEAFQAQNKISELLSYIVRYLSDEDNVMTVTEKHLRSKALAGQTDDTVDVSRKSEEGFEVGKLLSIWQELMAEKERLGLAIGKAKAGMDFNLDAAVDANKSLRASSPSSSGWPSAKAPTNYKSVRVGAMCSTRTVTRRSMSMTLTAS